MTGPRAALLDRDGTLMVDYGYVGRPEDVQLLPDVGASLRRLTALGLGLVVITNQSGIARGKFPMEAVEAVNTRLAALLRAEGVDIASFYVCPHGPDDGCSCRKPASGLALSAARRHGLELSACVCIGDRERDILMGRAVGAFTALLAGAGTPTLADVRGAGWLDIMPAIEDRLSDTGRPSP